MKYLTYVAASIAAVIMLVGCTKSERARECAQELELHGVAEAETLLSEKVMEMDLGPDRHVTFTRGTVGEPEYRHLGGCVFTAGVLTHVGSNGRVFFQQ